MKNWTHNTEKKTRYDWLQNTRFLIHACRQVKWTFVKQLYLQNITKNNCFIILFVFCISYNACIMNKIHGRNKICIKITDSTHTYVVYNCLILIPSVEKTGALFHYLYEWTVITISGTIKITGTQLKSCYGLNTDHHKLLFSALLLFFII